MKKHLLFKYKQFSAIFDTQQSKDFAQQYYHGKFGGNWTTNKGEGEGDKIPQPE